MVVVLVVANIGDMLRVFKAEHAPRFNNCVDC
jgi:hypothetical protein